MLLFAVGLRAGCLTAAGAASVELLAVRRRGSCSVLGFWQMGGSGQPLLAWQRLGSFTADLFALAVANSAEVCGAPRCWCLIMPRFIGHTWCKTGYSSGPPRD